MKKILALLVALIAVLSFASCGKDEAVDSKPDYSAFVGEYSDEVGGRATAEVTESEDQESAVVMVHWSSSYNETTVWTMTVTFDGEKLNYTDCHCQNIEFVEGQDEKVTEVFSNGSGYFEWDNGKMSWTGAAEESCQECVFVKAQ